jgi:hypothetical protein
MAALDIVVITPGANAIDHVGPDGLDLGEVLNHFGGLSSEYAD